MASMSSSPHEVDHLRDRVRLYLQVMLLVDLTCHASSLLSSPLGMPVAFTMMRWGETVALAIGWTLTKFTRPGRRTLVALETSFTIALMLLYFELAKVAVQQAGMPPAFVGTFALLGVLLLLAVRASLVPSSAIRTVAIGVLPIAYLAWMARQENGGQEQIIADGLVFMGGSFIAATGVTSHVIYGLRRQVRHALRLGQYELGRKIGEGGMGVVYKATHVMLRRPTAVKLLPPQKAGERSIARFEREVQQTSRLEHPNSVYIYDYGRTPDGQFYYAMEYLDGVTLDELVRLSGPLNPARTLNILKQAAGALAEAHAMGLIHRDIKPANIMLYERANVPDTVKVLDFGLVKEMSQPEADEDITQADTLLGTPRYLAPEAITAAESAGPPADIYALGAVAFFLLTGREVFTGNTVIEVCSQHLNAMPDSPSSLLDEPLDAALEALVLRCLAKEASERPKDGAELVAELEELHLEGWSEQEARIWWQNLPAERSESDAGATPERTQLTIDLHARD